MSDLRMDERPTLRRPVLITAFRGWNDGGQAATLAAGTLARVWDAHQFADIDPEGFVDFQSSRPTVSLDEGLTRRIEWPETTFQAAAIPGADRDADNVRTRHELAQADDVGIFLLAQPATLLDGDAPRPDDPAAAADPVQ